MSERPQPRDDLRALEGYHSPQLEVDVRLNTNESPFAPPAAFVDQVVDRLQKVDWNKYGVVNGVARDPRCENCMVHCGYDPSGALGTNYQSGDNWKNIKYNFAAKPKPYYPGLKVEAFTGWSIGKGHLAEAKAAISNVLEGSSTMLEI